LLPKSTCLVVVTSRRNLGLETAGVGSVYVQKLGCLSMVEAKAMLMEMSASRPTAQRMTEEQAEKLASLCEYLPLAIRVVGGTMAKHNNLRAETIIQRLSSN